MIKNENLKDFINYNYIPFSKKQCLKRLMLIWLFSAGICITGGNTILWATLLGIFDIAVSIVFIRLIVNTSSRMTSRFLCDGIFYFYVAVILNLASYRIIALQTEPNWMLLIIMLFLLLMCILIFLLITLLNIKSNNYAEKNNAERITKLPFLGGICGIAAGIIFLQGKSQQTALIVVAITLSLLSYMVSIPSLNLLKAIFYTRQEKNNK